MLFTEVINVSLWIQSETNCTFYLFADAEWKIYFTTAGANNLQTVTRGGQALSLAV